MAGQDKSNKVSDEFVDNQSNASDDAALAEQLRQLKGTSNLAKVNDKEFINTYQELVNTLGNNQVASFDKINQKADTQKQTFKTDVEGQQIDELRLREKELTSDFASFKLKREQRWIKETAKYGFDSDEAKLMHKFNKEMAALEKRILNNIPKYLLDADIRAAKGVIVKGYEAERKKLYQPQPTPTLTKREEQREAFEKSHTEQLALQKNVTKTAEQVAATLATAKQTLSPTPEAQPAPKSTLPTPKPTSSAIVAKKDDSDSVLSTLWDVTKMVTEAAWTGIKWAVRAFTGALVVEGTLKVVEEGAKAIGKGAESLVRGQSKPTTPDNTAYNQAQAAQAKTPDTVADWHQTAANSPKGMLSNVSTADTTATPSVENTAAPQTPTPGAK